MKTFSLRSPAVLLSALLVAATALAADEKKSAPPTSPAASAAAIAAYPLTTCVVSDEDLTDVSMGGPINYVYQVAGQPDRLVRFCCSDCVKDFKKDPAKFLKKIDDAAAAKAKSAAKK